MKSSLILFKFILLCKIQTLGILVTLLVAIHLTQKELPQGSCHFMDVEFEKSRYLSTDILIQHQVSPKCEREKERESVSFSQRDPRRSFALYRNIQMKRVLI